MRPPLARVIELADASAAYQARRPVAQWHWGPALQGYAYARLQEHLGDQRYTPVLERYARHHARGAGPVIDQSDTAAPGLITFELERLGIEDFAPVTDRVIDYVKTAPRTVGGGVNHLGHGFYSRLYPRSVWVDTLMMFGVFPAHVGAARGDEELIAASANLPSQCAELLQHPSGLWTHSYWAPAWHSPRGRPFPRRTFWARGNGWVVASLPMILSEIGDHPRAGEILDLLWRTSQALLPLQDDDGAFRTVLTGASRGRKESAATALIAAGWLSAARRGWLPETYVAPARRALGYVTARIVDGTALPRFGPLQRWFRSTAAAAPDAGYAGPVLTGISGPTIPMPVIPRLAYTHLTPDVTNASYGMAAAILAAIADDQLG